MACKPRIPLHHFTVIDLHRMRQTGVLPPRVRVELLAGLVVDKQRPSERELEAIRCIAGVLAEHLDAPIVAGELDHPDGDATFDATIMTHDWEHVPLTEPWPLHRFSLGDFDRMFETGILTDAAKHELLDGVVLEAQAPQPADMLAEIDARVAAETPAAVLQRRSAVVLGPYSRLWIDIVVCETRTPGQGAKPITAPDMLLAVDIAAVPNVTEQLRWPLYARWGVRRAWSVDAAHGQIRTADFAASR